jgi:anti-anti-sigma regulatory factor
MTLKIEKVSDGEKTVIRLSGNLQSEHLDELKTQTKGEHSQIALDLDCVTLVDVEVIRFLSACEDGGIELLHCWPYIREWMLCEQRRC